MMAGTLLLRALIAGLVIVAAARTEAAPIVSITPSTQDVMVGDPVSVNIDVNGLTAAVAGFQLLLSFDDSLLEGTGYTIGSGLGAGLDESLGFAGGNGSPLDLYFTSFEDEATLAAAQGTGFTLATVTFNAIANGLSPLSLSGVVLTDPLGTEIAFQHVNGSVCVGGNCTTVPEPGTLSLVGAGLAVFWLRRRITDR
jgi:hypothetical protein